MGRFWAVILTRCTNEHSRSGGSVPGLAGGGCWPGSPQRCGRGQGHRAEVSRGLGVKGSVARGLEEAAAVEGNSHAKTSREGEWRLYTEFSLVLPSPVPSQGTSETEQCSSGKLATETAQKGLSQENALLLGTPVWCPLHTSTPSDAIQRRPEHPTPSGAPPPPAASPRRWGGVRNGSRREDGGKLAATDPPRCVHSWGKGSGPTLHLDFSDRP